MKLSPNLSLFQILLPRDWCILPDLNWRQNWLQLILLNRAHQKVSTGDTFECPHMGNSVWFSRWHLISSSWLPVFVSKAHEILTSVAHSTASTRWFLEAQRLITTLCYFNPVNLYLINTDSCERLLHPRLIRHSRLSACFRPQTYFSDIFRKNFKQRNSWTGTIVHPNRLEYALRFPQIHVRRHYPQIQWLESNIS